ncbi:MAG TPA: PadR family transcriptional regulator [Microbacteriaceae bacterium]|nr:PadR family transcriptional regulator [Microbacteriaceae bacterium]
MSLRYALLALLTSEPMTGYDISRLFQSSVGHVWHAPDSQIYPELRKMEAEGLVEAETVDDSRGEKRFYRPTEAGIIAFRHWMDTPLKYALDRDPAHLRAAYFEWADPAAAKRAMRDHIERFEDLRLQWQGQIDNIDHGTSPVLSRRLTGKNEAERRRIAAYKRFAYEGLLARADAEISWARRGIDLIDELS